MAAQADQFFKVLPQRVLALSKPDGTSIPDLQAVVTGKTIVVYGGKYPIEVGDTLTGVREDGVTDRFYVTQVMPYFGVSGFPDHYQVKYGSPPAPAIPAVSNNTFNLHGPQSRAYIGSQDHSSNTIIDSDTTVFHELREALPTIADPVVRAQATEAVDKLEVSRHTPDFAKMVAAFAMLVQKTPEIAQALHTYVPKLIEMISSH